MITMSNQAYEASDDSLRDLAKPFRQAPRPPQGMEIGGANTCGVGRMSARAILEQRIARLRSEAERLEALLRALPMELPPAADEALWDLVCRAR